MPLNRVAEQPPVTILIREGAKSGVAERNDHVCSEHLLSVRGMQ